MSSILQPVPSGNITAIAYEFGVQDARQGLNCLPEQYFLRHESLLAYAKGHQAQAGKTILSYQLLRNFDEQCPRPLSPEQVAAEIEDLLDARDEEEWIRGGC